LATIPTFGRRRRRRRRCRRCRRRKRRRRRGFICDEFACAAGANG